ncbi:MAG: ABC transporter permease subunit [Nitrososphaerales archaeon]
MPLVKTLAIRGITLFGALIAVLILAVVVLGATGFSDNLLNAIVSEELRGLRQSLAQNFRDPVELENVISLRREELVVFYGLDTPWYFRLPAMVLRVLTLDLGEARTLRSFAGSSRVIDLVIERLPNTILLLTSATAITSVIGLYVGVKLATQVGSKAERGSSYFSAFSYALPAWWMGVLMIIVFAFQFRVLPSGGMLSAPPPVGPLGRFLDLLWHAILPVTTLVIVSVGSWIFTVRTMVLNTSQEDFVTVARAKGIPENKVMNRHIIRVAAPPIVTFLILGFAGSLGGAILTETVFAWPGMGRLFYDAILTGEESVIIALTFMFTLIYVIARFFLEVLYVVLDPRVRY